VERSRAATGACKYVLEGHENATCVLALPNGDIITGSTGRKSEDNRHVDYKLRRWVLSGEGPLRCYGIAQTIEDHEQAVRAVALLPDAGGWVSVGNDGAVKVRAMDGSVACTFLTPLSAQPPGEGGEAGEPAKHNFAYSVAVARTLGGPGGASSGPFLIVSCEPDAVRIIDLATGTADELHHPGACACTRALQPAHACPSPGRAPRFPSRCPSPPPASPLARAQASRGAPPCCRAATS
jgi:hypothetical protein